MFYKKLFLLPLALASFTLIQCGSGTFPEYPQTSETDPTPSENLPEDTDTFCTVKDNQDGTASITCPDGTTLTINLNQNSQTETNSTNCSVTQTDSQTTITCPDGTTAIINDGSNGNDGNAGTNGGSCTLVTDETSGDVSLVCPDGTSVVVAQGNTEEVVEEDLESLTISVSDKIATFIRSYQLNDGSFQWYISDEKPIDFAKSGGTNVAGSIGMGLITAYQNVPSLYRDEWLAGIEKVQDFIETDFDKKMAGKAKTITCPNFTFLKKYLEISPDTTLQTKLTTGFHDYANTQNINFADTTNDPTNSMRMDGVLNRIVQGLSSASRDGEIYINMYYCIQAAQELATLDTSFQQDVKDGLSYMANYVTNNFSKLTTSTAYRDLAVASVVLTLSEYDTDGTHSALLNEFVSLLLNDIDANGAAGLTNNNTESLELTAHSLLALKALGKTQDTTKQVDLVTRYLLSKVADDGSMTNNDGEIFFDTLAETLGAFWF